MANKDQFISQYGNLATNVGNRIGVDPNVLLGQWALETGWGKSVIHGTNNLGNIKDFSGGGVAATDNMLGSRDNYRKYESPDAFGNDYASLIERRYKNAVGSGSDAAKFAAALQAGGYAEDPNYVQKMQAMADSVRSVNSPMNRMAAAVFPSANAQTAQSIPVQAQNSAASSELPAPKKRAAWKDVMAKPEFQALSQSDKIAAQEQYFNEVVAPNVPPDQAASVKNQFFGQYPVASVQPTESATPETNAGISAQPSADEVPWHQKDPLIGAGMGALKGTADIVSNAQRIIGEGSNAFTNALPEFLGGGEAGNPFGNYMINSANERKAAAEAELAPYKAQSPLATSVGDIGAGVIATLPVGGGVAGLAKGLAPAAMNSERGIKLANAIRSGGFDLGVPAATGLAGRSADLATRALGGGIQAGIGSALIDPESSATGAAIGAAFPVVGAAGAKAASGLAKALGAGGVSVPVRNLATEADRLGITIPADRIANNKRMNALAGALENVPFSGRQTSIDRMQKQLNAAVSRSIGQEGDDVATALRSAEDTLGKKFDDTLRNAIVKVDNEFLEGLAERSSQAANELSPSQARVIENQINDLMAAASKNGGNLEGAAAYNIKKTLDRIGKRNSPEAHYAIELKGDLMDAMNRSMGEKAAADFAKTREQYGNMISLRKLVGNGAEGDISVARLANMQGIRSPELKKIADIAAQFVRPRDTQHSASQRALLGAVGLGQIGGAAPFAAAAAGGRMANAMMNSDTARRLMINPNDPEVLAAMLRSNILQHSSKSIPILSDTDKPL